MGYAYVKGNRVLGGNAFGYVAAQAAYTGGNEWLTLVLDQIEENYQYLKAELAEKLPEAVVTPLEGTYLCWINLEAYVSADSLLSCSHAYEYARIFPDPDTNIIFAPVYLFIFSAILFNSGFSSIASKIIL